MVLKLLYSTVFPFIHFYDFYIFSFFFEVDFSGMLLPISAVEWPLSNFDIPGFLSYSVFNIPS